MKFKWYEVGYIICFSLLIFCYAIYKPSYSGDMLGYIASVYKLQGFNKQQVYKKTYEDVYKGDIPRESEHYTKKIDYNNATEYDINNLWQRIPYYKIRILYINLINLIGCSGLSYATSSYIISAFFAALIFIIYCIIAKNIYTSIFSGFLLASLGILQIAKTSSPDSLAIFFVLLICLLYLSNYVLLSFIVAALLPIARTDYVIFSMIFSLLNYSKYKHISLIPLVAIPLVFIINKLEDNLGYLHFFNQHFINYNLLPNETPISHNIIDYIKTYLLGIGKFGNSFGVFIVYFYLLAIKLTPFKLENKQDLILICCLLTVICRLILFPDAQIRFNFGFYSIIMLISIAKIHNKIGSLNIVELYKNTFIKSSK